MVGRNVIMGIDPGTLLMGYAIVDVTTKQPVLLSMGVLKLSSKKDAYERLQKIHHTVCELIALHAPTTFAIEAPFYGKNVQSMLKLGRAQGVAIAAAMQWQLQVTEYSPKKIKQSITGNGNADKDQVWKMLQQTLKLQHKPTYFDASDALAVALCHYYQSNNLMGAISKGNKGWEDFVAKNPDRIVNK